jgi:hypothetical protein
MWTLSVKTNGSTKLYFIFLTSNSVRWAASLHRDRLCKYVPGAWLGGYGIYRRAAAYEQGNCAAQLASLNFSRHATQRKGFAVSSCVKQLIRNHGNITRDNSAYSYLATSSPNTLPKSLLSALHVIFTNLPNPRMQQTRLRYTPRADDPYQSKPRKNAL